MEFGADSDEEAEARAHTLLKAVERGKAGPHTEAKLYDDAGQVAQVWEMREGGVGHSKVPGEHPGWPSWEDAAVAPERTGRAVLHLHCHHRATADTACDEAVLRRLGLEVEALDAGCRGLAGSFGYEAGRPYEVSVKVGERKLLPAVRAPAPGDLIVTDGFSGRSQIEHGSDRRALHLAEVLARPGAG